MPDYPRTVFYIAHRLDLSLGLTAMGAFSRDRLDWIVAHDPAELVAPGPDEVLAAL